jgi:nitrite reductase/ring-hydroxylating ferredoxin subunit
MLGRGPHSGADSPPAAVLAGWGTPGRGGASGSVGGTRRGSAADPPALDAAAPPARLWMDSGVLLEDLPDAALFPPEYEYTVTGARRRKPKASGLALLPVPQGVAATAAGTAGPTGAPAPPPQPPRMLGRTVEINKRAITLFRYGSTAIAVDAKCPHNGAAMEGGDIEDFLGCAGAGGVGAGYAQPSAAAAAAVVLVGTDVAGLPPLPPSLRRGVGQHLQHSSSGGEGGEARRVSTTPAAPRVDVSRLCVVCPRHSFVFRLDSGVSEQPRGTFKIGRYDCRIAPAPSSQGGGGAAGGEVQVAMPQLDKRLFGQDLDF